MYQKIVENGYIVSVCKNVTSGNITEEEYNEIMSVISSRPNSEGKGYLLRDDLTWEEYDLPEETDVPTQPEEATEEDYLNALNRLGVETDE